MNRSMKSIAVALTLGLALMGPAHAQSTINTGQPGSESDLNSLVMRQQFTAAASDINGLLSKHAATSVGQCPATPVVGEECLTIGGSPFQLLLWTGAAWFPAASINSTTGIVSVNINAGNLASTLPITTSFSNGQGTVGLNFNSTLLMDGGNNLGINFATPNAWTGVQTFPAGSITNTELANSTISGISLGQALDILTFGNHLTAGGTQYNGSAGVTISTDASSIDTTGNTLVTRAGGNFSAGTITAALTGHASLDLALTGGTVTGAVIFSNSVNTAGALIETGTSSPASAAGNTSILGTLLTAPTLSNNGQAFFYNNTNAGAIIQGAGATFDFTLANKSGSTIFTVPTGTTKLNFPSLASVTCVSGLALDASNNIGLSTCPGAAASIQVGSTGILSGTSPDILFNNAGTLGNASITGPLALSGGAISLTGTNTAHGVPIWEGTAALGNTGVGTLGQFVGSGGAGVDPGMTGGPFTLISTVTAAGGATTLSDTTHITSSYTDYELVCTGLTPSAGANTGELQFFVGGTLQTSGYSGQSFVPSSSAIVTNQWASFVTLSNAGSAGNASPGVSFRLFIHNPSASAVHSVEGQGTYEGAGPTMGNIVIAGAFNTAGVITGYQVAFASGTINAGGFCKLYGRL